MIYYHVPHGGGLRQKPVSVWDRATLASLFVIAEDVDMAREEIVLA